MAYFKSNEPYPEVSYPAEENENEEEYDDGFDELNDEAEPELSEDERQEIRKSRLRVAAGAGNLVAVIGGALLILLLLTMIFSMYFFVVNDMGRSFSLFSTNF